MCVHQTYTIYIFYCICSKRTFKLQSVAHKVYVSVSLGKKYSHVHVGHTVEKGFRLISLKLWVRYAQ